MRTPIKILYIQTPGGGGSLFGLYEMLRQLDLNEVQPVVLSYYKNQYTEILETVKGVKVIEIYDAANKELLVKYDDKHNIDKVISALNIKSWKETEKSIGMNPKYTIKFYCDTTNQDEEKDIKEITLYENGEYATIFITSPGGVKQNYKTSIDISELVI